MPAPTDTLLPPRYGDVRPIAQGGMGEIFVAIDRELGREVVVKVLAKRYAQDDQLRGRFKREALAAARLSGNHNIVTIFDVGEHAGRPLIVMEHLAGGSLAERVDGNHPCRPAQVLDWLEQAASALDAAHAAGIVHRDVKPGNLLLDERGHVKVADFGIATAVGMDSLTQTGTILGTAGYLSPEQARGTRATAASDRYALAVVAWELLTGHRPFEAQAPTLEALAHVNAAVPSINAANPRLPRGLDPIFERALAKDPADRFRTASEFVEELRSAFHADAPPTRVATSRGRSRWWLPVLLLAAVIAGGIVAALVVPRESKRAAPTTVPSSTVHSTTVPSTTVPSSTARSTTTQTTARSTTVTSGSSGVALNDAGFTKMKAGDYAGALPLLAESVRKLSGSGAITEAYADYNLAYTRRKLGQCTDVLRLLARSQAVQGHRTEIDALRAEAQQAC